MGMELLAALACVDYVIPWKDISHASYLKAVEPRRITFEKGKKIENEEQYKKIEVIQTDYKPTEILFLPRTEETNTTLTIQKIKETAKRRK